MVARVSICRKIIKRCTRPRTRVLAGAPSARGGERGTYAQKSSTVSKDATGTRFCPQFFEPEPESYHKVHLCCSLCFFSSSTPLATAALLSSMLECAIAVATNPTARARTRTRSTESSARHTPGCACAKRVWDGGRCARAQHQKHYSIGVLKWVFEFR